MGCIFPKFGPEFGFRVSGLEFGVGASGLDVRVYRIQNSRNVGLPLLIQSLISKVTIWGAFDPNLSRCPNLGF